MTEKQDKFHLEECIELTGSHQCPVTLGIAASPAWIMKSVTMRTNFANSVPLVKFVAIDFLDQN